MQSNYIACDLCGHAVEIPDIFGGASFYSSGTRLICPLCGHATPLADGRYDFVADAWRTLRSSEPAEVDRFKFLVASAVNGDLSTAEAIDQAAAIHNSFASLLATAMNWGIPALLIAILALYLQYKDLTDKTDDEILAALKQNNATNEQVLAELKALRSSTNAPPPLPQASPSKLPSPLHPPNRHQRRKVEKMSRASKAEQSD